MATNEKKMTRVEALTVALNLVENATIVRKDEVVQKIKDIIGQIEKKNSSTSGKLTPKQVENEGIKASVLTFMRNASTQMFTISELMKNVPGLPDDMSNQRMNALLRQLYPDPKHPEIPASEFPVIRTEVKGKALFQVNPDFIVPLIEDDEAE